MMSNRQRQVTIQERLGSTAKPISATTLAKQLGVSRQTIVGDVALLRAQGENIIATPQGYTYETAQAHTAVIACRHAPELAEKELRLIVENGGWIADVLIEHPLYGQIRGQLNIHSNGDITKFVRKIAHYDGHLLSELTDGVHLHTISVAQPTDLARIKLALQHEHILYEMPTDIR